MLYGQGGGGGGILSAVTSGRGKPVECECFRTAELFLLYQFDFKTNCDSLNTLGVLVIQNGNDYAVPLP